MKIPGDFPAFAVLKLDEFVDEITVFLPHAVERRRKRIERLGNVLKFRRAARRDPNSALTVFEIGETGLQRAERRPTNSEREEAREQ